MPPVKSHLGTQRLLFGSKERISGTVYGTVVVMATLTAGSVSRPEAWKLAVAVAVTVLVLWAAHVYAHSLGESIRRDKRLDQADLATIARSELGIPLAAVGPIAALVLGSVALLRETTAVWLALTVGLLTLAVQGFRYAQIERLGGTGTVVAVAVNLLLGLTIVALKTALAH